MKKLVCLVLALSLVLSCSSAFALAAQFSTTREFLDLLDSSGVKYTLSGLDDDGDEVVTISNQGDAFTYQIHVIFDADLETTYLRTFNIINFSDADFSKVLRTCNSLCSEYNFVRFFVDESDNTVSCAMDMIYRDEDVGDIVLEGLLRMVKLLDIGYEALSVYDQ